MLSRIKALLSRLHRCEQGAEGLEKLLIVGAIVLPLLGFLIYYQKQIREWVSSNWETVHNDASTTADPNSGT